MDRQGKFVWLWLAGFSLLSSIACQSEEAPRVPHAAAAGGAASPAATGKGEEKTCPKLQLALEGAVVTTPSWNGGISAIVQAQCAGCHAPNKTKPDLSTYPAAKISASNLAASVESGSMPIGKTMSDADKQAIKAWNAAGAPENAPAAAPTSTTPASPATPAGTTETPKATGGSPSAGTAGTDAAAGSKDAAKPATDECGKGGGTAGEGKPAAPDTTAKPGAGTDAKPSTTGTGTTTDNKPATTKPSEGTSGTTPGLVASRPLSSTNPLMRNEEVKACFGTGKIFDRRPNSPGCMADTTLASYSCDWEGIIKAFSQAGGADVRALVESYKSDGLLIDQCGNYGSQKLPITFFAKENADKTVQIKVMKVKE